MEKMNSTKAMNKLSKAALGPSFSIDGAIKELSLNPLLKGYTVNVSNYNILSLYVSENSNCKKCKGLKDCKNNAIGHSLKITGEGEYHLEACPCKYLLEEEKNNLKKARFKTLYLSKSIIEANFNDFNQDNIERQKAYKFANNFVVNCKNNIVQKGLYVCGNFQIGKTYFLAATANLLAENDIDSLLIYFPDLVRELKSSMMDKEAFERKINMIKTVPVLMIDDLGAELSTAWLRDEILCPILNFRLQEKLPVFISSNLPLDELMQHYRNIDNDDNNARRVIERIKALTSFIEFKEK